MYYNRPCLCKVNKASNDNLNFVENSKSISCHLAMKYLYLLYLMDKKTYCNSINYLGDSANVMVYIMNAIFVTKIDISNDE